MLAKKPSTGSTLQESKGDATFYFSKYLLTRGGASGLRTIPPVGRIIS